MSKENNAQKPDVKTENQVDLLELTRTVWTRRRLVLKYAIVGAVLGLIIAFSIPKTYVTAVKLAPENKTGQNAGNMSGLAAMAGINLGQNINQDGITVEIYPEIVSSTPFLLEFSEIPVHLVSEPEKEMTLMEYLSEHQKQPWWRYITGLPGKAMGWVRSIGKAKPGPVPPLDSVAIFNLPEEYKLFTGQLMGKIETNIDKKTSLLSIAVTMQDPWISALVADSVVTKLQRYMILYKTQKTRHDLEQTIRQNDEARESYYAAEDRLVEAADKNRTVSTEALRVRIERLRNESELAFNVYNQTASQVEMNRIKLQEETPIATIVEPAIVPDRPAGPRKMMTLIGVTLLGAFVGILVIVFRFLFSAGSSRNAKSNGKTAPAGSTW